jgi:hypothetical protein
MVSVAVTGWVPEMATGWETEQVGALTEPDGAEVTAQVSATLPVHPPPGVTVMVEVPVAPGDAMLMGVPLIANPSGGVWPETVIAVAVVTIKVPHVPVTVAV